MTDNSTYRRARIANAVMFGLNGFVTGAWALQIPLLLPRHEISEKTLGGLILLLGLGAVSAMMFAGRLATRHGTGSTLRALSFALLPVLPLVVLAPSLPLLALAMMLLGASLGAMDVVMNANTVELEGKMGRAIMSSCHGCWSLGAVFGAGIGGLLITHLGAIGQALGVAGLGLIAALIFTGKLLFLPPAHSEDSPHARGPLLPRNLGLWLLGLLALFCMVPEGAVLDWGALYLRQDLGAETFRSGLAYAAFSATMALMRFAGDGLRNRFGAVRTLQISGLLAASGMILAAIAPNDILAITAFAISGLGVANMVPIMISAAGHFPGLPAATALSVVTMVGYSGILVAPASIGVAAELIGFRWTFAALAVLLLLVVALARQAQGADRVQAHH